MEHAATEAVATTMATVATNQIPSQAPPATQTMGKSSGVQCAAYQTLTTTLEVAANATTMMT